MKKLFVLSFAVVVTALSLSSCKKDYTCTCTYTSGGTTYTSSATIHTTKKKAKEACEVSATSGGSGWTCSID